MGHFQLFSIILKFSMGHFLSFYTDFAGLFSKLMGLWHMAPYLPNHRVTYIHVYNVLTDPIFSAILTGKRFFFGGGGAMYIVSELQ